MAQQGNGSGKGNGPRRERLAADARYAKTPEKAPTKPAPRKPQPAAGSGRSLGPIGILLTLLARFFGGTIGLIFRVIWGVTWRLGMTVGAILGLSVFYMYSTLPDAAALMDGRARGSVTLMDRNGEIIAWRGETYDNVTADSVAPALKNAVIATEDKRFYGHLGISPRGIIGAMRTNIAEGRGPLEGAGGSTITVQVAKLLCLGVAYNPDEWKSEAEYEADCRKSSIWRKVKEVPYALAMEAKYSKDEILTIYLNRAYLGAGARGFEAASERYFDKKAADLNPAEAAMLAGLLKAPSYFSPTSNLERSRERARLVLGLMREQDYLTQAEYDAAIANPAELSRSATYKAGGWFADWVMETAPSFLSRETTEDVVMRTTFDQKMQRAAERALRNVFAEKVKDGSNAQAAVVIMSADGAVRAMIGGRNQPEPGAFNRATMAKRQTGSSFKPFVFAAALDLGYTPDSIVDDAPITIRQRGSRPWSPENYTRTFRGPVSLTTALSQSLNTATIRLQEAVGREAVRHVAADFGFASDLTTSPSLGLGVSESSLLEMTGAYAGILNGGTSVRPYGIAELRIRGDNQPLIGASGGMGERVISQRAAQELTWMMRQVIEGGTGSRARLPEGRPAAGKTGTTSAARDAWFIGFTAQYVAGVWMGYDDNTPLKGVTGGGLPAEIWQAVMAEIHKGVPVEPLTGKPAPRPTTAGTALSSTPQSQGDLFTSQPSAQPAPATIPPGTNPDVAEDILKDVLGQFN
ncbi:transglycosylase domain-containing protein [Paracoccus sp. p4-l81]|uniref:transglycosylase domain-containing protein n=1 Tax=Paracoccus sp. p4-l81 TaxID=3342806 RepID=UPI0035B8C297